VTFVFRKPLAKFRLLFRTLNTEHNQVKESETRDPRTLLGTKSGPSRKHRRVVRGPAPRSIEEKVCIEEKVYIDKIRLGNVPLLLDFDNEFGFHHEKLIGSSKKVKCPGGQTIWMKIIAGASEEDSVPREGATKEEAVATGFRSVRATVDFNPSRFVHPNPRDGYITARELPRVLNTIMPVVFRGLGIEWIDLNALGVRVQSIDLARDFQIRRADLERLFHDIRKTRWRYRPTLELINTAGEPDNTLRCRRRPYQIQLYDQKQCHESDFPTDLRCEMRIHRTNYPRYWDLTKISAITPQEVLRILRGTFKDRVPFGAMTSQGRLDFHSGELVP
jgi:hypothetical protein